MAHEHHEGHHDRTDARSWLTIGLILLVCLAGAFMLQPKRVAPAIPITPPEKAVVTRVIEREDRDDGNGVIRPYQKVEVRFRAGANEGLTAELEIGAIEYTGPNSIVEEGDRIYVLENVGADGERTYFMTSRDRARTLLWLGIIFVAVVLLVSRKRGLRALVALAFGFLMVTTFMIPQLAAGRNLVLVSVIGSILILGPTYLISYGATRKSALAAFTTIFTMFASLALTHIFSSAMGITGLADSEAVDFAIANGKDGAFLIQLFIAGTLIGILGVLDDVIIAQISTVFELGEADKSLGPVDLFRRAMRVGNDHIASVVNTLILAYAGASLPLFLFFSQSHLPFGLMASDEAVATELVRMLAGTVSLVMAVPLSTAIAAAFRLKRHDHL